MILLRRFIPLLVLAGTLPSHAQTSAVEMIRTMSDTELKASAADHNLWRYRDRNRQHGVETVALVVDTRSGSVKKIVMRNGRPLTAQEEAAETKKVQDFISDPAKQRKQKKDGEQDDVRARGMLELLPKAFVWTVKSDSGEEVTLHFEPDPKFVPPSRESRVLAAMAGEVVIHKADHRMVSIRGALKEQVNFGFGLLGKLEKGGTFNVIRHQVKPGIWETTETHVHMQGHALLFKSISEQEDDVQTDFATVPPSTSLADAAAMLQKSEEQVARSGK